MLEKAKLAYDIAEKLKNLELKALINDLREDAISLGEENRKLREELRQLRQQQDIKDRLVWDEPYYFLMDGKAWNGPYCQRCQDDSGKLIRLQKHGRKGQWKCVVCDVVFHDGDYTPPKPQGVTWRA